jgi:hypothetical protein
MPRYFLHQHHTYCDLIDPEGSELPDLAAAQQEAREGIRAIAAECLRGWRTFELVSMRICNEQGTLLAEVFAGEAITEVIPVGAITSGAMPHRGES